MPEAPRLYLESTVSHKPTRNISTLQSQKEEGAPVPLCISLLAGGVMKPKSGVGEAQGVSRVETPMGSKGWVRPPVPQASVSLSVTSRPFSVQRLAELDSGLPVGQRPSREWADWAELQTGAKLEAALPGWSGRQPYPLLLPNTA